MELTTLRRALLQGWTLAVPALLCACARQAPPPGGPPDTSAPEVMAVTPAPGSVGVERNTPLTLMFSEKIDPAGLEKSLWITPGGLAKPKISVSGAEVTIRSSTPLPESTTVAVLVTTQIQDKRQNVLRRPHRWVFSTGDRIWPGSVRGKVVREETGQAANERGQILVGLYPSEGDTVPDPSVVPPVAITQADSSLGFVLDGLPARGERWWLLAMIDRDGNRLIRGGGEFVTAEPESVTLTPESPSLDAAVRLLDPAAPGSIKGELERSGEDTTTVWVELTAPDADSLATPVARTQVGDGVDFVLSRVPPGVYILSMFCDPDEDGSAAPGETRTVYGRVQVYPGRELDLGVWSVPVCPPLKEP